MDVERVDLSVDLIEGEVIRISIVLYMICAV